MCKLTLEILQQRIFGRHYDKHDLAHLHSSNSAVVEKEREGCGLRSCSCWLCPRLRFRSG